MARILVTSDQSWYDELAVITSYYESEFENKIRQHIANVFPDYHTVSFNLTIEAEQREPKKPDLAMIRKDYKDWWIIEIELSVHSLKHIEEQVSVFSEGKYNSYKVSEYLSDKCKSEIDVVLDNDNLKELIKTQQPKVLVIVDDPKPDWEKSLSKYDAHICIFQVFKNKKGFESFRLDGRYPEVPHSEFHCRYHLKKQNTLEVISPLELDIKENEDVEINYNGKISKWKRIDANGSVYLKVIGGTNPIPTNYTYVLFKDAHDRYILKLN